MTVADMEAKARWVRQQLFEMDVPLPSTFSCVEILVALYYGIKRPEDLVVISKGHGASVRYPILEDLGLIPAGSMQQYRKPGALLKLYAEPGIPETHVPCASLGIGFGVAAGMALADRSRRVFVVLGDGECYEGSVWETAMFAAHHQLTNLVAIIDRNRHSVMDKTEVNLKQEPMCEKWQAFGWDSGEVGGHDFVSLLAALRLALTVEALHVIIAKTIKAKGLSFWEDQPNVHSAVLTPAQREQARKELYT